jgi:hypothetical protein
MPKLYDNPSTMTTKVGFDFTHLAQFSWEFASQAKPKRLAFADVTLFILIAPPSSCTEQG